MRSPAPALYGLFGIGQIIPSGECDRRQIGGSSRGGPGEGRDALRSSPDSDTPARMHGRRRDAVRGRYIRWRRAPHLIASAGCLVAPTYLIAAEADVRVETLDLPVRARQRADCANGPAQLLCCPARGMGLAKRSAFVTSRSLVIPQSVAGSDPALLKLDAPLPPPFLPPLDGSFESLAHRRTSLGRGGRWQELTRPQPTTIVTPRLRAVQDVVLPGAVIFWQ